MLLIKDIPVLQAYLASRSKAGESIGFVPTMGALHEGHFSLVETALSANACTVCSIFVNPTQFNDPADFEKYPITLDTDIRGLEGAGCSVLFLPTASSLYPGGTGGLETYDLGFLDTVLEGPNRPGHFQGVCQVMRRLLEAVKPQNLYMGQKDYQQCMVVSRLLEIMGASVRLYTCPTLREADGLAMSSRNRRLSEAGREKANGIYQALSLIKKELKAGPVEPVLSRGRALLEEKGFQPEYLSLADASRLEPVNVWDGKQPLVALAAAFLEGVRLIDNMTMN
jgi:pantoate--beta-alanine ligase